MDKQSLPDELGKNYNHQKSEIKWYQFWEEHGYFKADPESSKPSYSLLMPPPNVTGALHMGHAMEHSVMDAIARFKRMNGFDVLLLPGADHAGIQFEGTLNKLLEKEGLSKQKLDRDEWLKRAWQFKEQSHKSVSATWRVMGLSADWSKEVFTLDPKVAKAVLHEFQTFWDQGLLYKGAYIVQWCPKCGTAIEDVEMEYEEKKEKLYFIKYQIAGDPNISKKEYITIATGRPETIYADTAIAVHPESQYKNLIGKDAYKPLYNQKGVGGNVVQIISDTRVDKDFGTGALKITPGHDPLDYQIGKDNNLPVLHAIDKTGRMTELAQELTGLKVLEAREEAVKLLEKRDAIEKIEEYTHSVPVCERCSSTIEPLISEEWFVNMTPLAQKAIKKIGEINFVPKNYQKILSDWLENLHDWCISRPLWWGYRIPVWYCQTCNPNQTTSKDGGLVISTEKPDECPKCQSSDLIQDEKLLDTWFSSGLWPMATLGWPEKTKEFEKYFPWDFETSDGSIKYLWISRMIMLSLHFTDKIPFKNQFFHGTMRDLQGRKFAKSLGNGVDPNDLREAWGTDATRMTLYTYSAPGRDGRASRQTMDERTKNYRNFTTKLWNIGRFIIEMKPEDAAVEFNPTHKDDKEIVEKLNEAILQTTKNIEGYNLHLATEGLYEFVWHTFADKYIESTKKRRAEAQPTLEYIFKTSLELLHPFMPFITEELWQKLPHEGKSIMLAKWPSS